MNYNITPGQVRYIQTMRRRLFGEDRAAYEEMLWGQARVKSCKDLKGLQIDLVIRHLEKSLNVGRASPPAGKGKRSAGGDACATKSPLRATARQLFIIRSLWAQVSRAPAAEREKALRTFLGNRFGMAVPEWLTLEKAAKVIEALKKMAARTHRPEAGATKAK